MLQYHNAAVTVFTEIIDDELYYGTDNYIPRMLTLHCRQVCNTLKQSFEQSQLDTTILQGERGFGCVVLHTLWHYLTINLYFVSILRMSSNL